jgi:hypothetical protein
MHREWSDLAWETTALSRVREQLQAAAAEEDNIVFAGNINLNTARRGNVRYGRRCLKRAHDTAVSESNMRYFGDGSHVLVSRPAREGGWRSKGA